MKETFDFIKAKKYTFAFSGFILLVAMTIFLTRGGFQYGIDFQGGGQLQIDLGKKVTIETLEAIVGKDVDITEVGNEKKEFLFKAKAKVDSEQEWDEIKKLVNTKIIQTLKSKYPKMTIIKDKIHYGLEVIDFKVNLNEDSGEDDLETLLGKGIGVKVLTKDNQQEYVIKTSIGQLLVTKEVAEPLLKEYPGLKIKYSTTYSPTQGKVIKEQAILVSLLVLVLILVYIGIRFQFKFGVAAIIALIHDVFIVLAFIIFFGHEIDVSIVVALLTIMGYSLNDTIVVFDRIRENKELLATEDYIIVVNKSIYQSLSRTVVTSLTTLFVVGLLFIFGGAALNNLSFSLLVGIVAGTYSSIFIASPTLVLWENYIDNKIGKKAKGEKQVYGKKNKQSNDKIVV